MNGLAGARVLLIGTGSHGNGSGLPNVPAVADTLTDLRAALIKRCSVEPCAIEVVQDPASPVELGEAVAAAAEAAEGVLLVYYVGHGLVSPGGILHLATTRSDRRSTRVEHTALAYDTVRALPAGERRTFASPCRRPARPYADTTPRITNRHVIALSTHD